MTVNELVAAVEAVEAVTDEAGNKKAVLDWAVWEEMVALLTDEIEDEVLVASGLLPRLIERAKQEPPSPDWKRALHEL